MAIELRCSGTLHGILSDDHTELEVKCKRRACGAAPGIVVLHTIRLDTGRVANTKRFAEPPSGKEKNNGSR